MIEEWRVYRKELRKSLKSLFLSVGISLLFYIVAIPSLKPNEHLKYLTISLVYGLIIYAWIWILYAVVAALVTRNKIKSKAQWTIGWSLHLPIGFFGMAGGLLSAKLLVSKIFGHPFRLEGLSESLLTGVFIALMFQFYYAYKNSKRENLELRTAKTEAELRVLKDQMQPHFLFNSLNSLAELIESNKELAALMAQNLADLYREILQNSRQQVCSLESEISIIKKYLDLEKLRFGERLTYSISVPSDAATLFLPSLVLQTLVENAIKHGISKSIEGGVIDVVVSKRADGFCAAISNTGSGPNELKSNEGIGIKNTISRLSLLYGDKHQFEGTSGHNRFTVNFWFSGELVHE